MCRADTLVRCRCIWICICFCICACFLRATHRRFIQRSRRSQHNRVQQIADLALILRKHPFEHGSACSRSARNQYLLVNRRSRRHDMRLRRQLFEQRTPIVDAVAFDAQQTDVRCRAEQPRLQVLAESVIDGQRDDERSDARSYSQHGNSGDDADKRLAAFGAQITGCDEEFEAHQRRSLSLVDGRSRLG